MKSFAQLQQETTAVQLDFLLTDITAANTFLDVAETTRDAETRTRNVQHAKDACTMVSRLSGRLQIDTQQSDDIQKKLDLLRQRIGRADRPQK